jgi:cytochrome c556
MKRTILVASALLLSLGGVMAQQDQLKVTQAMMKGNGKNAGALAAIVKGEKPYDQATVDAALVQFDDTAKKLPTLFPESIKGKPFEGDYSPSSKIWEDKAGFNEHIASFAKVVSDAKGKIKDADSLKAELSVIGKQCGGCHETYRIRKT